MPITTHSLNALFLGFVLMSSVAFGQKNNGLEIKSTWNGARPCPQDRAYPVDHFDANWSELAGGDKDTAWAVKITLVPKKPGFTEERVLYDKTPGAGKTTMSLSYGDDNQSAGTFGDVLTWMPSEWDYLAFEVNNGDGKKSARVEIKPVMCDLKKSSKARRL